MNMGTLIIGFAVGLIIGAIAVSSLVLLTNRPTKETKAKKAKPRRPINWKRWRRESENRATLQAVMMVESGAFTDPTRR